MARVEMHCIAAAFGARFPGSRFCVSLLAAMAAKLGVGVALLGKSASSSLFGLFLGDSISHSLRNSTSPVTQLPLRMLLLKHEHESFFVLLHLGILAQSVYGANLILGASSFSPKRLKREASVMLADAAVRFC